MIPYGRQWIGEDDIQAVVETLKSDFLTTGPKVAEFEGALASYVGAKNAVAVSSGTAALDIAVGALGLPRGSEIITSPFTFAASANCAIYNGCVPVFADIDKRTYNISPEQIRKKITKKTRAIVYIDYAGQPCNMDALREIASEKGLFLIEDACHALGARYRGKRVGAFADMTVFSFHPVKHITTGEGGAVTTENADFAARLRLLRNHGIDKTPSERAGYAYDMKVLGRNYRITDIQCALGISQFRKADKFLARRGEIARQYNEEFAGTDALAVPYVKPDVMHAYHLYPILVTKGAMGRDAAFGALRERGIGVNVHYIPTYKFSYYRENFRFRDADYPVTESVSSREISLPMYPAMGDEDVKEVVSAVKGVLS